MGQTNVQEYFTQADFSEFSRRLDNQVDILRDVIRRPGFGDDPLQVGAELEMYLLDENYRTSPSNTELLADLGDPQFQPEINKYNIELNLSACPLKGRPFTAMLEEMRAKTDSLEACAAERGINIMPVGILPTLTPKDLDISMMTDAPRYRALGNQLKKMRNEPFKINIRGDEPVEMLCDEVTMEGANTSFQVHMMVKHARFADIFNAAQLTLPLILAASANSGLLMGNQAWDETRVALFKQSLDTRRRQTSNWQEPARVAFGHGWVRKDAWELFTECVALFPPILPYLQDEDAVKMWADGEGDMPALKELCMHIGTTWPWHRPVYSNEGNGHVRIEFRALPAGPTSIDMVANAAFSIGLATGMADVIEDYMAVMPFRFAEYNFYRAAKHGLDANILWPFENRHYLTETPLIKVVERLGHYARKGLESLGVARNEIDLYLGIIHKRIACGVNGARWKKNTLRHLESSMPKDEANQQLTRLYIENARTSMPVAEWDRLW